MSEDPRYAIGDLAALGGVSRRTVRYYVQEGLIPPPLGVGRGNHYATAHLEAVLRVKALQESGRTLDDIRRALQPDASRAGARRREDTALQRTLWRRIALAPGVELHVTSTVGLPSSARLRELGAWCREHFADAGVETKEND